MKLYVTRAAYGVSGDQTWEVRLSKGKEAAFLALIEGGNKDAIEKYLDEHGDYADIIESTVEVTSSEFQSFEIIEDEKEVQLEV